MWLARPKGSRGREGAMVGAATVEGETAAYLDGERRNLTVFGPGGYCWRPTLGQELLVIKGEGAHWAAGARAEGEVAPGEVLIYAAAGGASIRLKGDGSIAIAGRVTVNGTPIEELGGGADGAGGQ